ncbi:hypothetical protein TNCV_2110091 [Trichonephila clavipes]|nr:hypothetical protein TNCV_2110091 [Trichonephila clavipes]
MKNLKLLLLSRENHEDIEYIIGGRCCFYQVLGSVPIPFETVRVERRCRGTLNSRRTTREVEGPLERRPRVFSLKIWVESSQMVLLPVWCSKLWLMTGVHLAP